MNENIKTIEAQRLKIKQLQEENEELKALLKKQSNYCGVNFDRNLTNEDIDREMGGYTGGYSSSPKSRY